VRRPVSHPHPFRKKKKKLNNVQGIGAAIAKAFADAGCRAVAITDIDGKKLLATKDYIISKYESVTVLTATGDVADEKFVQSFIDGIISEVGRLDYAVRLFVSRSS